MIYDEEKVLRRSESSRESAVRGLEALEVYCGREPHVLGLNGWVFEQTVQSCIKEELEAQQITADIGEQVPFEGRVKARLRNIAQREGADLQRLQRWVAFERLLARLFVGDDPPSPGGAGTTPG